jgi:tRNA threonylcarbamoyladenosine biosynthesis protein TsaE
MSAPAPVITRSEEETAAVAAGLARSLRPGSVVLLFGDLGAGKTAFVRGMAAGLAIDPDAVSSPTFTLIQEYRPDAADRRGGPALYHVDLYRVDGAEVDDLGLDELTAEGGIVAIEWAEKLARPIPGAVRVSITEEGEDGRRIEIRTDESRPTQNGKCRM